MPAATHAVLLRPKSLLITSFQQQPGDADDFARLARIIGDDGRARRGCFNVNAAIAEFARLLARDFSLLLSLAVFFDAQPLH